MRTPMTLSALLFVGLLCACGDTDEVEDDAGGDDAGGDDAGGDDAGGDDGDEGGDWTAPDGGVVELETQDGVTLVADYYPHAESNAPSVVLLHMIPPSWDRTSWPESFITDLGEAGFTVINVDRRGAGDSEGRATDAYDGPKGKYDVEAAVLRLEADGYTGDLAVLGASNGSTSALDYAVWAGEGNGTTPAMVAFLTGGTYTEAQNDVANVPVGNVLFTYSTEERGWSVDQQEHDPGSWTFMEYEDGDHGTKMFGAVDTFSDDLVGWLSAGI